MIEAASIGGLFIILKGVTSAMSASGPKRTWACALHMSAFGGKADMVFQEIRFRGCHWGQSGHCFLQRTCPLMTQSGHEHLSRPRDFTVTMARPQPRGRYETA